MLKTLDPWLDVENIIPLNRAFSADCSFSTVPSPPGPPGLGYPDITPSAPKDGQTPRTGVLARQIAENGLEIGQTPESRPGGGSGGKLVLYRLKQRAGLLLRLVSEAGSVNRIRPLR